MISACVWDVFLLSEESLTYRLGTDIHLKIAAPETASNVVDDTKLYPEYEKGLL